MLKKVVAVLLGAAIAVGSTALFSFADNEQGYAPYRLSVCINGDAATRRGFLWYTKSNTENAVQIFANGSPADFHEIESSVKSWKGAYVHKVTVDGLTPGTHYTYRVGNGSVWSEEGSFVTDDGDDRFSFLEIADVQANTSERFMQGSKTLQAAFEQCPEAEFAVNCGDFTNDSTNEQWDMYDEAFAPLNRSTTTVPVAGNHDGLGVWHWFENMFDLDTSGSVQTLNGVNYSFDYGNAHFAVLNTNDIFSVSLAQLTWLKNDLNGTAKDWKLVLMHKCPYTLGKDGKWPDALYLQKSLTCVLEECGVDLVLCGHDHMYLRTKPLKGGKAANNGVTYVLSGTAGYKRYEVRPFLDGSFLKRDQIAALTIQKDGYGNYWNGTDYDSADEGNVGGCYNRIDVDGGTLTLRSYIVSDKTGEVKNIDTFTVTKSTGKNKASFSGDNTVSAFSYAAGVLPSFSAFAVYTLGVWLPQFLLIVPQIIKSAINGTF